MKIEINNILTEIATKDLKSALSDLGYLFPCGGKGICGRCKIIAPTLQSTERDRRFLTQDELSSGIRLACDKTAADGLKITPLFGKKTSDASFRECDAYAILYADSVETGVVSGDFSAAHLSKAESLDRKGLRSAVAHGVLEFLEEYSVAKATTLYLIGETSLIAALVGDVVDPSDGDTISAALLELPAEDAYVLPTDAEKSSIDRLSALMHPDETLSDVAVRLTRDVRMRAKL